MWRGAVHVYIALYSFVCPFCDRMIEIETCTFNACKVSIQACTQRTRAATTTGAGVPARHMRGRAPPLRLQHLGRSSMQRYRRDRDR